MPEQARALARPCLLAAHSCAGHQGRDTAGAAQASSASGPRSHAVACAHLRSILRRPMAQPMFASGPRSDDAVCARLRCACSPRPRDGGCAPQAGPGPGHCCAPRNAAYSAVLPPPCRAQACSPGLNSRSRSFVVTFGAHVEAGEGRAHAGAATLARPCAAATVRSPMLLSAAGAAASSPVGATSRGLRSVAARDRFHAYAARCHTRERAAAGVAQRMPLFAGAQRLGKAQLHLQIALQDPPQYGRLRAECPSQLDYWWRAGGESAAASE